MTQSNDNSERRLDEARRATENANHDIEKQREMQIDVDELVRSLRELRRKNHFAEALVRALRNWG